MRLRSHSALRPLIFPNGSLILLGMAGVLYFLPVERFQQGISVLCVAVLAVSALLAVRLHSLRAFLASASLAAQAVVVHFGTEDPAARSCAALLLGFDLALILLVEDNFFDWQAVAWWTGLLSVQWAIFLGVAQWNPALLADIAGKHFALPFAGVGFLEMMMGFLAVLLLTRYGFGPDAVGAGMVWALLAQFPGLRHPQAAEAYIALAGMAIAIAVVERSYWIAYHDELTGLPGRRAFNEALAALGEMYSIAVVDVDHFKRFNDTFGHDTGDQVLRKVAAQLSYVRYGKAYRVGGEEFALVFPERDTAESGEFAEEVRVRIEQETFIVRGPERSARAREERRGTETRRRQPAPVRTSVTVSIGLAESPPEVHDVHDVIAAADKALYRAKNNGRNRVELAPLPRRPRAKSNRDKAPVPSSR
ncbi:MAG: GGDEF domain-containing protein [Acidobacteriales bacterium]|nr:GGDEF domain-containing protein [Terriglobales bacterium]